jgi:hypothetical protein
MLDEARQMQNAYVVTGPDNKTKPGTGQKVVAAWLKAFEASRAKGNQVVLLPYGDPDVASLIEAGDPLKKIVGDARAASEEFNLAAGSNVAAGFTNGLWLENGSARSKYLAAASSGFRGSTDQDLNLVSSSSWTTAARPNLTPSPVYDVQTPEGPQTEVRTVIADSALTAGGPDPDATDSPIQARQRFAAETALLAASGASSVSVVALPPRGWDADGRATVALASGLSLPWITQTDVSAVVAAAKNPQTTKAPNVPRTDPVLNGGQVDATHRLTDTTLTFRSLLAAPENLSESMERALPRSASTGWRDFPEEGQRYAAIETASVNQQLAKVHLVNSVDDKGLHREIKVNLAGSKGTFPLTITNNLDYSVRVGIVVTPANRTDLRIKPVQTKVLGPKVKATYPIAASAEANGVIRANVQVVTAAGDPVGKPQELVIQASQYGSVGWILVGAACALLFGTSFVRIYRRIRTERRNPAPPEDTPDPLHPAPLDPEATTPDRPEPRLNGVPAEGGAPADESLKEGVGSKDG